jgi:ATP-dependent DNA helicase RecG
MPHDLAGVLARIQRGTSARKLESQALDFKVSGKSDKDTYATLAQAAVCFANAAGGTIVLGVSDDVAGEAAFVGTDVDPAVLRRQIYDRTTPALDVSIDEVRIVGVRLLVIRVPEGLEAYGTSDGRYSWRRGTDCLPMRPEHVARLREERRGDDWSTRSAGRGGVDAVDTTALSHARELLRRAAEPGLVALASASEGDLLSALGVLTPRGHLTNAGWLTFGRRESRDPVHVIYQHRRTAGGEPDAVLRLDVPLLLAVERILEAVDIRRIETPVSLPRGQQIAVQDFPSAAVREAVLNAVVHGDHRAGRPIQVEHAPDALIVTSPGPLVAGVTPTNILRHPHRARFRSLFDTFRRLGLVEQVGLGVDRMFREMLRDGREAPRIREDIDSVQVTLIGDEPNVRIARFVRGLPAGEQEDVDVLLVLSMLRRRRSVTAREVGSTVQRTQEDAQDLLRRLASGQQALIEPTAGSAHRRFPNYRLRTPALAALGPAISYHRQSTDEVDRKTVEHVREYGSVNNRTIQNLFDVDVFKASAILRDLVSRGVLEMTTEQRRGTAVRYGPGSRFPLRDGGRR